MAKVPNAVEILPKIWTAWVRRTNVTDDRWQTTDRRQTDGQQHIANVNVSSRSLIIQMLCRHFLYFLPCMLFLVSTITRWSRRHPVERIPLLRYSEIGSVATAASSMQALRSKCSRTAPSLVFPTLIFHISRLLDSLWPAGALGLVVARWSRSTKFLYTLGPVSTGVGDPLRAGKPPRFVTSHSGQLSLLSSAGWKMSAGQIKCGDGLRMVSKGRYGLFQQNNINRPVNIILLIMSMSMSILDLYSA